MNAIDYSTECENRPADFIVEICPEEGRATVCSMSGEPVSDAIRQDLLDCTSSGDCEDACQYVLDTYDIEWRTVARVSVCVQPYMYLNVIANAACKRRTCETIYFESEANFSDVSTAELYLIWQAAHDLQDEIQDED